VLMETEIWPCAVAGAKARGLPLVLANGRLSEKTVQQALTMSPLAYPAYAGLTAVCAQTMADAKRYRQLGVEVAGVFGNIKFDASPSPGEQATGKAWRQALDRPVVMFASSRVGEEVPFLELVKATAQSNKELEAPDSVAKKQSIKYLIVPRHPQRFDEVAALVVQHGLTLSRRSSWQGSPRDNDEAMQADIWLGDTLGEMALYYALSDVALLGGSFEKLGGQNLIEAAACGCPVVMGPHTFNFAEAAELAVAAGAAFRVTDMASALLRAQALLVNPAAIRAAQSAALDFSLQHRGATEKTCRVLTPLLLPG
jgi:3-deoxy-D-manno-octulosonic-acid transferase